MSRPHPCPSRGGFGPPPTLLYITIVLGMVAAASLPLLRLMGDGAAQRLTIARIETVASLLHDYMEAEGTYPTVDSIEDLAAALRLPARDDLPTRDGWDRALRYECWQGEGRGCTDFAIGSAGRDGAWQRSELRDYSTGPGGLDADLVYRNDAFVRDSIVTPLPRPLAIVGGVLVFALGLGVLLWLFYGVVLPVLQWIDDRR